MTRGKLYYSPRLRRELIPPLYHAARSRGVPMTTLASEIIAEGLQRINGEETCVVAEEPPIEDPDGRQE